MSLVIRGIENYYGDESFDEISPDYYGVFDGVALYAYQWLAAFRSKEDAELFLKIKDQ
jgi:hypothetical protein